MSILCTYKNPTPMTQKISSTVPFIRPLVRIFHGFTALIAAVGSLAAEEQKTNPLVYCVAYAPDLATIFTRQSEDRYQSLALSTANVLACKDVWLQDGQLSLHGPADPEGKHPVVATADLSQHTNPLLILNPAKAGEKPPYAVTVLDANLTHFPLGSYQILNLSPHVIRITQDKDSIEIPAGGRHIYAPKAAADAPLSITMDYKLQDEWQLISSSNWSGRNDRRTLVCVLEDTRTGRIIIKSIPLR